MKAHCWKAVVGVAVGDVKSNIVILRGGVAVAMATINFESQVGRVVEVPRHLVRATVVEAPGVCRRSCTLVIRHCPRWDEGMLRSTLV